jgi:deoxyribodipyrimidine photo-lyase
MRPLVWFRSDLRIQDNYALFHACRRAKRGVVAVFCVCEKQWVQAHEWGTPKADMMLRGVGSLSESLAGLNIALKIVREPTYKALPKALLSLAKEHRCDALAFNDEHELNERQRDDAVITAFQRAKLEVHRYNDATIFEPGSVLTQQGNIYTVFTPFKNSCRKRWSEGDRPEVLGKPKKQPEMVGKPDDIPSVGELKSLSSPAMGKPKADHWQATEAEAERRLNDFCNKRISAYKDRRDYPAVDGTSTLSPFLATGLISPRQCIAAAHAQGDLKAGVIGWVDELIWREFYHHLIAQRDTLSMGLNFRREYDAVQWSNNRDHLEAWKAGRTGYPIVDAAMRQVEQIGWMHNRLRMVVAMFLTKHLLTHWREGEQHFCRRLVDLDYASNNGGWQWSSSTGTDAQPYFRVFNPTSQSEKFDADGEFIRSFVPELAELEPSEIHDPPAMARAHLNYPQPIVEHKQARERAIEAFKAVRS